MQRADRYTTTTTATAKKPMHPVNNVPRGCYTEETSVESDEDEKKRKDLCIQLIVDAIDIETAGRWT